MYPSAETKRIKVLIPDGDSHLLVYAINCLSDTTNIDIYVMSSLKRNPMRFSRYLKEYIYYKEATSDQEWMALINTQVEEYKVDVVMPIFENGIRRVIKNKDLLLGSALLVSLPDFQTFTTAINKWELSVHCKKYHVSVPESFLFTPKDIVHPETFSKMKFPVILKPLEGYGGGMGIHVFKNEEVLIDFLNTKCEQPSIIQDYIEGYDIDCSILANDGEVTAYTIQKGFLAGATKFKPQVGVMFEDNQQLLDLIKKLIKSLNWSGIAHIDCRYDKNEKVYKIIEINPRIWVTIDGSSLMGVNFPYLWILQSLEYPFEIPVFKEEKYLNLKGFVKTVKNNISFLGNLKFIMKNTQVRFVVHDPVPTLYKFYDRTKNILRNKIGL